MEPTPGLDRTKSPKSLLPSTPEGWLMLVAGIACIGYGLYTVVAAFVDKTTLSLLGMFLLALGGMVIPIRWVGLVVGLILLGLGVFMFATNYVTVQALVVCVLGLIAVAERWRRI